MLISFLASLLSCLSPTLAFSSLNATYFTTRQICGVILISSIVGCGLGAVFMNFSPPFVGMGISIVYFVFAEQFLYSIAQEIKKRILLHFVFLSCSILCAYYIGLIPHCVLLALQLICSFYDLRKNIHLPKIKIFNSENLNSNNNEFIEYKTVQDFSSSIDIPSKQNVYFLFLESFHSTEAVSKLYGLSDEISHFLRKNQFTIFENVYSNACFTDSSINTIFNMNASQDLYNNKIPKAFYCLKTNGYNINIYDTAVYTFMNYIKYCDYFNFNMSKLVAFLYNNFLPLFLQSKIFLYFTKVDPFTDSASYAGVKEALKTKIYKNNQFHIMRFGANHSSLLYTWKQEDKWKNDYIQAYKKAEHEVKDMISFILKHDPSACIVAMGDHGAWKYRGIWRDGKDYNQAMRAHGVEPALVCMDVAGILLAVRPPDGTEIPQKTISPANVFRLVFSLLGAQGKELEFLPNMTFFWDSNIGGKWLIAEEGVPLADWEYQSADVVLARNIASVGDTAMECLPIPDILDIVQSMRAAGKYDDAVQLLQAAINEKGRDTQLLLNLGNLYSATGRGKACVDLLAPALHGQADPILLPVLLKAMCYTGASKQALALVKTGILEHLPQNTQIELKAELYHLVGDIDKCIITLLSLIKNSQSSDKKEIYNQQRISKKIALCMSALHKNKEAVYTIDNCYNSNKSQLSLYDYAMLFETGTALSMVFHDYQYVERRIELSFCALHTPYPATIYVWLCGALEQQNKQHEAFTTLTNILPRMQHIPFFLEQVGLFCIRNYINDSRYKYCVRKANTYLKEMEKLLIPIFDSVWYGKRYSSLLKSANMKPIMHFMHYGRVLGLDPCPYFNSIFYCLTNRDVFAEGYDPLRHYLSSNPYDGRDPSLLFSTYSYLTRNPDVSWSDVNPLVHMLSSKRSSAH